MGRTLCVDPGEDTGWCIGKDGVLLGAGTAKMWDFADAVYFTVIGWYPGEGPAAPPELRLGTGKQWWLREGIDGRQNKGDIDRIVCEDFRIYPWKAKELAWDSVRTARLIGALKMIARVADIPFQLYGANIKERAVAGGAEELFYKPLHENRHQNDAIMHFVYDVQMSK